MPKGVCEQTSFLYFIVNCIRKHAVARDRNEIKCVCVSFYLVPVVVDEFRESVMRCSYRIRMSSKTIAMYVSYSFSVYLYY